MITETCKRAVYLIFVTTSKTVKSRTRHNPENSGSPYGTVAAKGRAQRVTWTSWQTTSALRRDPRRYAELCMYSVYLHDRFW